MAVVRARSPIRLLRHLPRPGGKHHVYLSLSGRVWSQRCCCKSSLPEPASLHGTNTGPQAVITWFALAYIVLSEVVPALQITYHIIAVLVLEGLLVILWLATFASTAAARAAFVDVSSCFGTFCVRKRAILYGPELDKFSATAGIGALVWLLFIASCVWTYVMFFKARKEGHFQVLAAASTHTAGANNYQLESKLEAPAPVSTVDQTQMPAQYAQPTYGQQPYTAPVQGTYPPQEQSYNQYPPQQYPPQQYAHEGAGDYQNMPPHGQPIPSASPPPHQS
jgi:hypothetical protein